MSHEHSHHHRHGHSHAPVDFGRSLRSAYAFNFTYVAIEVICGLSAHSLALVPDVGHNLGDVFGLLLAWGSARWANRPSTLRHTYGWGRFSILAALCHAVFLLISVGVICWEAMQRLWYPSPVEARTIIWVSDAGVAVNAITALMFMAGRKGDLKLFAGFPRP